MTSSDASVAESKPHIGIVGAGISGLRCADVLLSEGFEVTILEARDRIGGRVRHFTRLMQINSNGQYRSASLMAWDTHWICKTIRAKDMAAHR